MSEDDKIFALDKRLVRVLVVDDEASIREMLGLTLKDDGWTVELAENGKVAFEKLSKSPFHIVLSDIQMPEMSGIELLEAVKRKNPNIEVIIMTSNATLETAMKAIKSGAYDYLNKPFDDLSVVPKKLMQVAERILLRQQNVELLKRLKLATKHLKLLFEATRELNGILVAEELRNSVLKSLPVLMQDASIRCMWLKRTEKGWDAVHKIPDANAFAGEMAFPDLDSLAQKFGDHRKLKVVRLENEGQIVEAIVFENLVESLSEFFFQEVRTCYEKTMLHQKVLGMANRDGLTQLYNHRYFQDRLRQEISQVRRQNGQLSLIMMDVDHFKKYNDAHGHPAGDELLRQLSHLLENELGNRESDILARYGGEEFVLMLPFTPYEGALTKAERIREAVAKFDFPNKSSQPQGCVSLSIGVASFPNHADDPALLIEMADQALYGSKEGGRNRVTGYAALPPKKPAAAKAAIPTIPSTASVMAALPLPPPPPPPPPATSNPLASNLNRPTLDAVLKSAEVIDQKTPPAEKPVAIELTSLMSSIESAFAEADKELAAKQAPAPSKEGTGRAK